MTILETLWQTLEPALTPGLIAAVALTIAVTHYAKTVALHWRPDVAQTAARWRAFCATASVIVGALAGVAVWLSGSPWWVVPVVAFGSGPVWRAARVVVPQTWRPLLETTADRQFSSKTRSNP